MDKRKVMLLLGAMGVALGSALAVHGMIAGRAAPPVLAAVVAPVGPRVLVAQRSLPVGTIITPDAVAFRAWPRDMVQDAYLVEGAIDRTKLVGTVVRIAIAAGQPLTQGALVAPGDRGFLAAALGPGLRAVTIPVTDMSGVAGFIFPGDHVDMMLTQSVRPASSAAANPTPLAVTETVLRDLRVLATDQTTETEIAAGGKSVVKTAHEVTLEVTPRIAEKIAVAQTLGTLSLTLRALADDRGGQGPTGANGALAPLGPIGAGAVARAGEGGTSFATGGDVSRFARRALPVARASAPAPGAEARPQRAHGWGDPTLRVARGNTETAVPVGGGMRAALPAGPAGPLPVPTIGG